MTRTQEKIARLTKRVERIEQALEATEILASPTDIQAPICVEAYRKLADIVEEIRAEWRSKGIQNG